MKRSTRMRVLGSIGIIGCSSAVHHVLVVANAPAYYFIFYVLALLGAFVLGAAHDPEHSHPWRELQKQGYGDQYGTRIPRDDGAPLDYPAPPAPPPPPPKNKLPGGM